MLREISIYILWTFFNRMESRSNPLRHMPPKSMGWLGMVQEHWTRALLLLFWSLIQISLQSYGARHWCMPTGYVALSSCAKKLSWVRKIFWEMNQKSPWTDKKPPIIQIPTTIYLDSTAAVSLPCNSQVSARNKHIDLKIHHVRDLLGNEIISLKKISSNENSADVLTKDMKKDNLKRMVSLLHLDHSWIWAVLHLMHYVLSSCSILLCFFSKKPLVLSWAAAVRLYSSRSLLNWQ